MAAQDLTHNLSSNSSNTQNGATDKTQITAPDNAQSIATEETQGGATDKAQSVESDKAQNGVTDKTQSAANDKAQNASSENVSTETKRDTRIKFPTNAKEVTPALNEFMMAFAEKAPTAYKIFDEQNGFLFLGRANSVKAPAITGNWNRYIMAVIQEIMTVEELEVDQAQAFFAASFLETGTSNSAGLNYDYCFRQVKYAKEPSDFPVIYNFSLKEEDGVNSETRSICQESIALNHYRSLEDVLKNIIIIKVDEQRLKSTLFVNPWYQRFEDFELAKNADFPDAELLDIVIPFLPSFRLQILARDHKKIEEFQEQTRECFRKKFRKALKKSPITYINGGSIFEELFDKIPEGLLISPKTVPVNFTRALLVLCDEYWNRKSKNCAPDMVEVVEVQLKHLLAHPDENFKPESLLEELDCKDMCDSALPAALLFMATKKPKIIKDKTELHIKYLAKACDLLDKLTLTNPLTPRAPRLKEDLKKHALCSLGYELKKYSSKNQNIPASLVGEALQIDAKQKYEEYQKARAERAKVRAERAKARAEKAKVHAENNNGADMDPKNNESKTVQDKAQPASASKLSAFELHKNADNAEKKKTQSKPKVESNSSSNEVSGEKPKVASGSPSTAGNASVDTTKSGKKKKRKPKGKVKK